MAGFRYFALNVLLSEEQYDVVDGWLSLLRRTYLCEQYDVDGWLSYCVECSCVKSNIIATCVGGCPFSCLCTGQSHRRTMVQRRTEVARC